MKKVIALALAVLMLATIAFAAADVAPGSKIRINRDGVTKQGNATVIAETTSGIRLTTSSEIAEYIPRSVTSTNYSVTNIKFKVGKGLVESVTINDTEERVEVKMAQDLTNVTSKNFEVSFKLKGKAKYTLQNDSEVTIYDSAKGNNGAATTDELSKVTLPSLDFNIMGTVGYAKASVSLGSDTDEEIDGLDTLLVTDENGVKTDAYVFGTDWGDFNEDILQYTIFNFSKGTAGSTNGGKLSVGLPAQAGSYTADAMLYQDYGDAMSMEARVYDGDKLYLYVSNTPNKTIVNRLADTDADLDFYFFEQSNKTYTTFNSNARLCFNDADEECFVYKVNDNGYLVPAGEYSEEDGCWVVKTRTLGQYVVSDTELSDNVVVADGDPSTTNPDTGANDVVGIAAALAAVALVSAAAISLKK